MILILLSLISITSNAAIVKSKLMSPPSFHVVIDAGHGGSDAGALQNFGEIEIHEKEITLSIAKEISKMLHQKKISHSLTRNADTDIPLYRRTQIANSKKASLFISLHVNSKPETNIENPSGIETYILNQSNDQSSIRLAKIENKSSALENIIKDIKHGALRPKSLQAACIIQKKLTSQSEKDRGVKEALFQVLLGAEMPSVLVEMGFFTNAEDRTRLLNPEGRRYIAKNIVSAIEEYSHNSSIQNCKTVQN